MTSKALVLVVMATVALGCGDDPPSVSASASQQLTEQVGAARAAATAGDAAGAEAQLAAIRASVEELHGTGDVDAVAVKRITAALDDVRAQLGLVPTTTTTTTTAPPPPPPADDGGDEGEGNGRGGKKGDDDDD